MAPESKRSGRVGSAGTATRSLDKSVSATTSLAEGSLKTELGLPSSTSQWPVSDQAVHGASITSGAMHKSAGAADPERLAFPATPLGTWREYSQGPAADPNRRVVGCSERTRAADKVQVLSARRIADEVRDYAEHAGAGGANEQRHVNFFEYQTSKGRQAACPPATSGLLHMRH